MSKLQKRPSPTGQEYALLLRCIQNKLYNKDPNNKECIINKDISDKDFLCMHFKTLENFEVHVRSKTKSLKDLFASRTNCIMFDFYKGGIHSQRPELCGKITNGVIKRLTKKNRDLINGNGNQDRWKNLNNILKQFSVNMANHEEELKRTFNTESQGVRKKNAIPGAWPIENDTLKNLQDIVNSYLGSSQNAEESASGEIEYQNNLSHALVLLLLTGLLRGDIGPVLDEEKQPRNFVDKPAQKLNTIRSEASNEHYVKRYLEHDNPDLFVKRPIVIQKITDAFENNRIVYLCGEAGSGKSEMAREYAQYANYSTIIWKSCPEHDRRLTGARRFEEYSLSELKGTQFSEGDAENAENDTLIIIDNFNDVTAQTGFRRFLKNKTGEAKILVTTTFTGKLDDGFQIYMSDIVKEEVKVIEENGKYSSHVAEDIFIYNYNDAQNNELKNHPYLEGRTKSPALIGNGSDNQKQNADKLYKDLQGNIEAIIIIARSLGRIAARNSNTDDTLNNFVKEIERYSESNVETPRILNNKKKYRIEKNRVISMPMTLSEIWKYDILHLAPDAEKEKQSFSDSSIECLSVLSMFPTEDLSVQFLTGMLGDNADQYEMEESLRWMGDIGWLTYKPEEDTVRISTLMAYIFRNHIIKESFLGDDEEAKNFRIHIAQNLLVDFFDTVNDKEKGWYIPQYKYINILKKEFLFCKNLLDEEKYETLRITPKLFILKFFPVLQNFFGDKFRNHYLEKVKNIKLGFADNYFLGQRNFHNGKSFFIYSCLPYNTHDEVNDILDLSSRKIQGRYYHVVEKEEKNDSKEGDIEILAFFLNQGDFKVPDGINDMKVKTIGPYAGIRLTNYTGKITLGKYIEYIGPHAFENNRKLKWTGLPSNVEVISDYAFYRCQELTGELSLPNNIKEIGQHAFDGCAKLQIDTAKRRMMDKKGNTTHIKCGIACFGISEELTREGNPHNEFDEDDLACEITDQVKKNWMEKGFDYYFPNLDEVQASSSMALINWIWTEIFETNLYERDCICQKRILPQNGKRTKEEWYTFLHGEAGSNDIPAKPGDILWFYRGNSTLLNAMIIHYDREKIWLTAGMRGDQAQMSENPPKGRILWNCVGFSYEAKNDYDRKFEMYFKDSNVQLYILPEKIRKRAGY